MIPASPADGRNPCPSQVQLTAHTPRKTNLRRLLKKMRNRNYYLKQKIKSLAKTAKSKFNRVQKINNAFELLEGLVSPELLEFLKTQTRLANKRPKGKRYAIEFKAWASNLYHTSGKAYRFLAKLFDLPSKFTLTRMISNSASEAGFSERSLFVLKQRIEALPPRSKICTLLMDGISLKSNIFYDSSKEHLIGLDDYWDKTSSGLVATSALVFMVRGVLFNWKQLVAYYLVHESSKSNELRKILREAFNHLASLGLYIVALVSDQGSNFQKFIAEEHVSPDRPFIDWDGKRYFILNDPPHLLKSIRNNLMKYKFVFDDKVAQWADIIDFYSTEKHLPVRMAPKLTEKHLNPNWFM